MALKFSMLLEAIDRVTGPSRRIQNSMRNIGRQARDMARDVGRVGREAAQVSRLDRLSRRLAGGFAAAGSAARRYAGKMGIGSWGDAAEKAGVGVGMLAKKLGGMALGAAKWAGAAAIGASGFALFDLFGTASKFEQFQIMLEGIEGSSTKASRSMAWVQDFAATTPYELDQVMEAFVSLKAYGIDPLNGSLMALGDGASGMSKPIMQAVEALADATTGEFERLKEFGIRASKIGDQVAFTYSRNGKEVRRQVKMNAAEVEKAITGIMTERFGGMMNRQSQTFAGIISNLKDKWSGFLLLIARAGIFDMVKGKLDSWLGVIDRMAKDGRLAAWAEKISKFLEKAFQRAVEFVENTDWGDVATKFERLAIAAGIVADAVIKISEYGRTLGWLADLAGGPVTMVPRLYQEASSRGAFAPRPAQAPARSSPLTPGAGPLRSGANPVQVGGKVSIELKAAPGTQARVKGMKADNPKVPLLVQLGRSMGGPE